ncbi:hypothetical protein GGI1_14209 [Acidithiobacillus sp. GGI-221]|nr:hypothetical protein GGI1_14209 [Acidithiobacillus sp. GGI-221]
MMQHRFGRNRLWKRLGQHLRRWLRQSHHLYRNDVILGLDGVYRRSTVPIPNQAEHEQDFNRHRPAHGILKMAFLRLRHK